MSNMNANGHFWHEADIPEIPALVPNSVVHVNAYVPSIRVMASCKSVTVHKTNGNDLLGC